MNPLPLLAGWQAEHQHHGLCPHLVTSYTPVSPHFACVSGTTSLFLTLSVCRGCYHYF
jgi:hypothetical protein